MDVVYLILKAHNMIQLIFSHNGKICIIFGKREILFSGKLQLIFDDDRNDPIVMARSGGGDGAGFHITENYCFYDGFRSLFTLFMMSI